VLRAPFNSFQHRADQAVDDGVSDVDALASNEATIAGSPLVFFDGYPLAHLSPMSPGGAPGIKPSVSSEGANSLSMSLNVQTAPAVTVADGASVEISGVSAQSVTFTGTTGTLKLDNALAFTGEVSGLAGSDAIDLADVSYGVQTQVTFLGDTTGGTLTHRQHRAAGRLPVIDLDAVQRRQWRHGRGGSGSFEQLANTQGRRGRVR
jgi:hypothetical protein